MIEPRPFGETPEGLPARIYTLEDGALRVGITDFGGRIVSVEAPDIQGERGHVLLGFADVPAYVAAGKSFGAIIGRVANRIAGGHFSLDGQTYDLARNEGANTLHGGPLGFDMTLWQVEEAAANALRLSLISPDGDQGFPGDLRVDATYRLGQGVLSFEVAARTTKATPVNLSLHPYFNLGGPGSDDILGHEAMIAADRFLPLDARQIPDGRLAPVLGTPFDFRRDKRIGADIRQPDDQLLIAKGYDHYLVFEPGRADGIQTVARFRHPGSGRTLEIATTAPGGQFFTGNVLDGSVAGTGGIYRQSDGFAFEPQGFPNAPNQPDFPSVILRPREVYRAVIRYRFGVHP